MGVGIGFGLGLEPASAASTSSPKAVTACAPSARSALVPASCNAAFARKAFQPTCSRPCVHALPTSVPPNRVVAVMAGCCSMTCVPLVSAKRGKKGRTGRKTSCSVGVANCVSLGGGALELEAAG